MPMQALAAFHDFHPKPENFHDAVVEGLSKTRKTLPCKFFYDAEGSRLFERICALDEYYPTRTDLALLEAHAGEIAELAGPGCHLVEFGSGASVKVRVLLGALEAPRSYVPIDISRDHLIGAAADLARKFPDLPVVAVCADYTQAMDFPDLGEGTRVGFFPGSTIGNFTPDEAAAFLDQAREWLLGGGLVIGVDLRKDVDTLHAAYNDTAGVTAAFNKNLLARCNRELDSAFDLNAFRHEAVYVSDQGRVEMHLVSTRDQLVSVGEHTFAFSDGETIHTENSYKYTVEGFRDMARRTGFRLIRTWTDPEDLFSVHYLAAA